MLTHIPVWHIPCQWENIGRVLRKAVELDPRRDMWTVFDQAMSCELDFWRVGGALDGYLVTQTMRPVLWVIYVAGRGGSMADKRRLMAEIEDHARRIGCDTVKFEGRDWRRVVPEYSAQASDDGRWHFYKRL